MSFLTVTQSICLANRVSLATRYSIHLCLCRISTALVRTPYSNAEYWTGLDVTTTLGVQGYCTIRRRPCAPVTHTSARPGKHFTRIPFKIIYLTNLTSADITSSTLLFSMILSVFESVKHPASENDVSGVSVGVGAGAGAGTGVGAESGEGAASPVLWYTLMAPKPPQAVVASPVHREGYVMPHWSLSTALSNSAAVPQKHLWPKTEEKIRVGRKRDAKRYNETLLPKSYRGL